MMLHTSAAGSPPAAVAPPVNVSGRGILNSRRQMITSMQSPIVSKSKSHIPQYVRHTPTHAPSPAPVAAPTFLSPNAGLQLSHHLPSSAAVTPQFDTSTSTSFSSASSVTPHSSVSDTNLSGSFTSPSQSSPIQPQQLNFAEGDRVITSPLSINLRQLQQETPMASSPSPSPLMGLTSPIAPFPFACSAGSLMPSPVVDEATIATMCNYPATIASMRPSTDGGVSSSGLPGGFTPIHASVTSSASLPPLNLNSNYIAPLQSLNRSHENASMGSPPLTPSTSFSRTHSSSMQTSTSSPPLRGISDSPSAMEMGTTPPTVRTHPANAVPFISPVPIRCVQLNGKTTSHIPRSLIPASPSPLAAATSLAGKHTPVGASSRVATNHMRSSSIETPVQLNSRRSASRALLSTKRNRGLSMDLEAERDAGSSVIEGFDPDCPAAAITQSMRKLRVKKGAESPPTGMMTARGNRKHRNSGFSSSEDEDQQDENRAKLHNSGSAPPTQNMKALRRQKQQQSVQKKREAVLAEHGMNVDEDPVANAEIGLVAALEAASHRSHVVITDNAIRTDSDETLSHQLSPPMMAIPFSLRSPLRPHNTNHTSNLASPSTFAKQLLRVAIPNDAAAPPAQPSVVVTLNRPAQSDVAMILDSPPAVKHTNDIVGSRLTWSSDEEEDAPIAFNLPPMVATLNPRMSMSFKPLPGLEDERPVETKLDFGAAAADHDEEETRDTMGVMMNSNANMGVGPLMQQQQQNANRMLSPVPHHTPLTPAPTNHSFNFQLPHATPLPVLPSMAPPRNQLGEDGNPIPTELDFQSPIPQTNSRFFPPTMSPDSAAFQLQPTGASVSPLPFVEAARMLSPNGMTSPAPPLLRNLSDERVQFQQLQQQQQQQYDYPRRPMRSVSNTSDGSPTPFSPTVDLNQFDASSPPTSPPAHSFSASKIAPPGFLAPPNSLFAALSPDPKAFLDAASLQRRTPMRGKLQPPPTPVRPSSIKRSGGGERHYPTATPARPMKPHALPLHNAGHPSSSSKLLHQLSHADSPGSPPPNNNSNQPATIVLPTMAPRTRLERTSSLYDSKVLIDFKAHCEANALAKKKAREEAKAKAAACGETLDENCGDSSMNSSPCGSPSNAAHAPETNHSNSPTTSPATSVVRSIWEEDFKNKLLVGSGSFFQTFRCQSSNKLTHPDEYGQFFAVKRSIKEFRGKKDRGLYLREIAVMESIGDHENIVKHYRAWQEDLHFFIQMEICPMNLSQYIVSLQREGAATVPGSPYLLSDSLLKNITMQLASALHHIHTRNLIHLDVKPDNVLVSFDGILKLADFGQARLLTPMSTNTSSSSSAALASIDWDMDGVEGDSIYMSPELLDPSKFNLSGPTAAADIFSLGLLLVELASGVCLPKSGPVWHSLRDGHAHEHIHDRVSPQMSHIILNLLEPNPYRRPTAKQILEWLETHQS